MNETSSDNATNTTVDPKLLAMLCCPLTHKPVVPVGSELVCYESRKAYPIEDGIPVMLVEEARDVDDSEVPEEFRGRRPLSAPE